MVYISLKRWMKKLQLVYKKQILITILKIMKIKKQTNQYLKTRNSIFWNFFIDMELRKRNNDTRTLNYREL